MRQRYPTAATRSPVAHFQKVSQCDDGDVTNSDATYNATVASGGTLILPDISFTDSDGTVSSVPSVKNIVATPCGPDLQDNTCDQLNNTPGLLQAQRDVVQRRIPLRTGVTTSILAGDDGDLEKGFPLVAFGTLSCNNSFGNTDRFTDDTGAQTYANPYIIDHATGLGWYKTQQTAHTSWANALALANASVVLGFTDWRMPNVNELISIFNWSIAGGVTPVNYAPFSWSNNYTYTSTPFDAANVYVLLQGGLNRIYYEVNTFGGGTIRSVWVRNHF